MNYDWRMEERLQLSSQYPDSQRHGADAFILWIAYTAPIIGYRFSGHWLEVRFYII